MKRRIGIILTIVAVLLALLGSTYQVGSDGWLQLRGGIAPVYIREVSINNHLYCVVIGNVYGGWGVAVTQVNP